MCVVGKEEEKKRLFGVVWKVKRETKLSFGSLLEGLGREENLRFALRKGERVSFEEKIKKRTT